MQLRSVMMCITLLLMSLPAFASGPALNLGQAVRSGSTVSFPVTLSNVQGTSISGVTSDIGFNPMSFALIVDTAGAKPVSAAAGAAATAAGKQIIQSNPASGVLRIVIFDLAGNAPIPDGAVAQITFTIKAGAAPGNNLFTNTPAATDPKGDTVAISGSNTALNIASKAGDCDGNGTVSSAEVQSAINMFLGLKTAASCVDLDNSRSASISEVQKAIKAYLGL
jgi:hypothetical protein